MLRSRTLLQPQASLGAAWGQGAPLQKVAGRVDSVTPAGTIVYAVAGGGIRHEGTRLRLSGPGVELTQRSQHSCASPTLAIERDSGWTGMKAAARTVPVAGYGRGANHRLLTISVSRAQTGGARRIRLPQATAKGRARTHAERRS
jgi:hypothetical protein